MIPSEPAADRGRIGLIAGSGRLPVEIAKELERLDADPYLILLEGEAGREPAFLAHAHRWMRLEDFGQLVPVLKAAHVGRVVMAGGVDRRPRLRDMRWSGSLLAMVPTLLKALAAGDDGLLRVVIGHLAKGGMTVVGAQEIVPNLLAPSGPLTVRRPGKSDLRDIAAALEAARAIGALDIGQGAIAVGGRAVALEGIEGTDGLLERMETMRGHGRLAGRTGGVLVKCAKPGQELRADLPTIGPRTVVAAAAAGLAGVAVEADHVFILDCKETVENANRLGLFVCGLGPGGLP